MSAAGLEALRAEVAGLRHRLDVQEARTAALLAGMSAACQAAGLPRPARLEMVPGELDERLAEVEGKVEGFETFFAAIGEKEARREAAGRRRPSLQVLPGGAR